MISSDHEARSAAGDSQSEDEPPEEALNGVTSFREESESVRQLRQAAAFAIAALPPLGDPSFWRIVQSSVPPVAPEALIWVAQQFYLRRDVAQARQAIEMLYERYGHRVEKLAEHSPYLRSLKKDDRDTLCEEITQRIWMKLLEDVQQPDPGYCMVDFEETLIWSVRTIARTVARHAGLPVLNPVAQAKSAAGSLAGKTTKPRSKLSPRAGHRSLDAPIGGIDPDDGTPLTLGAIYPDPRAADAFDRVDFYMTLEAILTSEERQIVILLADQVSQTEIARLLHRDRQTVARRLTTIRKKVEEALPQGATSRR